jgi:CMP-N-acetylneuraminic acid synthetase
MSESVSTLAVIPARGGSKGIPKKNIRILSGKPLIVWNIEAALAAASVDRVVVSTDDGEIARIAEENGAEIVLRPPELSDDRASSESALLHVLETLEATENYCPDVLAFLQCTSPLTMAEDIDGTAKLVMEDGYDTAVTVTPFHYFIWREDETGQMVGVNHEASRRLMRQQRTPEYMEVGAVYAMRVPEFRRHRYRFFGRIGRYDLPASRAVEIDELADWAVAEALMQTTGRTSAA